jgi:CRP-like cAMP-binding protein
MYTDFGVQPLSLLTGSAVVAAVVGFGLQETLGNIFSGLTIQMQKPFEPGDWVRSAGHLGRVRGIGWRSTTIVTRANERVEIPNALLAKDVLYNYATGHVRDEFKIGVSYGVAPNHVREVVLGLLHDVPLVLRNPPPDVLVSEFGESAIEYRVRYYMADYGDQERLRDLVMSRLWYAMRRHSIEIPFPIRTIRMDQPHADERAAADFEHELMAELRHVPTLHQLSDEELRMLVPTVVVRQFGAGEVLMRQDDEGESLCIIRSGSVEVLLRAENGSNRHVANLGPTQFFGEAALLLGEPRNATIRAVTDVEVLEMDREGFTRLFKEHPEAASQMSDVIAAREAERKEVLAAAGGHDGTRGRRVWLFAKMREIFDF